MPLNRERVLQAALQLVDAGGIESLTMRTLGRALGVEAMSLYNHVANKDDLLDGILDLVLVEFELPSPSGSEDWEAAIRRGAVSAHDALRRHPWACRLVMSPDRISLRRLRFMDALLGTLRAAGFSPGLTFQAYHALDSHILGFSLWEAGHTFTPEQIKHLTMTVLQSLPVGEFPHLMEHAQQHFTGSYPRDVGAFEFGLGLILDGLKRTKGTA